MINEPALRSRRVQRDGRDLWRLVSKYYLVPHWPKVLIGVLGGSLAGIMVYAYAAAGQVVADDIVQVHLLVADRPPAEKFDPTRLGEQRRFGFDEPTARSTVSQLESKPGRSGHEKLRLLLGLAVLLFAAECLRHVIRFIGDERMVCAGQSAVFRLRGQLHAKLMQLPMSYHDRHSPGGLLTHLFSDLQVIRMQVMRLARSVPANILSILVGMVIVLVMDLQLAALVLLALPAYAVVYRWFGKRLRVVNSNLREREGRLNAHVADRVSNFLLVKSFVRETGEAAAFLRQARPIVENNLAASFLNTGFSVVCGVITGVSMTAVLWLGALRVRDGQMTAGQLMMFYASAGYLFRPIGMLTQLAGSLHRLRAVAGRVMGVLDEPITPKDPVHPLPTPDCACQIRFEHVTMDYGDGRSPALENVSFTLPAGKRLCVMGASGSGKTTLAKLVCRFYEISGGTISFDGIDLRSFQMADIQHLVGYVAQEPVIFSGTINENIGYGSDDTSPAAVMAAARFAQIHDFISDLPQRYHTLTYERGLTLSGGQKQRVSLARALAYNPRVLVLDDCTSALDAQTEAQLLAGFDNALSGRTVVQITHRTSIAMTSDYVLMLDKGRVVQFGPPQELQKQRGPFAEVVQEQARGLKIAKSA